MFSSALFGNLLVGTSYRPFRTNHVLISLARSLVNWCPLRLTISLSLARFNEPRLVGVLGTATTSIFVYHERSISVSSTRKMPSKNKNKIPDRWMDYQALGKRIPGTRFVAFKVPLKQSLRRCLPPSEAFGPFDLVRLLEEEKEELGLIVDLTFTTRYYNATDLPDSVQYLKIFTTGHQVPSDPTILSFKKAVYRFLQENKNNDKLIGIHCTHGLNRTGYLVCRYLVDVEGMVPSEAVTLFNRSRGHPIERKNYLYDLFSGPERSNEGMEEPDQDPIWGSAGCSQDDTPVCRCSNFDKSLQQSHPCPDHPPDESRSCDHEQAWRAPQHPGPPPCPVSPGHVGAAGDASSKATSRERSAERPQPPHGKPRKQRHRKKKGKRPEPEK